jgi:hypothetical protein
MENEESPHEPDSVLGVEWLDFPENVGEWILVEAGNILE